MNEAVAYKDEVARIGLQRGPSEKPACHMNTNMMKKALLSNSHNSTTSKSKIVCCRSSIYSINKLGLPQKLLLNYL
jgi:hypothetical protein